MSPSVLAELRYQRQKRLAEALIARRRHRGIGAATKNALRATASLLRAEVKARPKTLAARGLPDMFEGLGT